MLIWPANSWVFWLAVAIGTALFLRFGVFPRRGGHEGTNPQAEPPRTRLYILGAIAGGLVVVCAVLPSVVFSILTGAGIQADVVDVALWTIGGAMALVAIVLAAWALFADRARGRKRCPRCWYDMAGSPTLTCPECGKIAASEKKLLKTRRRWRFVAFAAVMLLIAGATALVPSGRNGSWPSAIPDVAILALAPFDLGLSQIDTEIRSRLVDEDFYAANSERWPPRRMLARWAAAKCLRDGASPEILQRGISLCWESEEKPAAHIARIVELAGHADAGVHRAAVHWLSMWAPDDPGAAAVIDGVLARGDPFLARLIAMGAIGEYDESHQHEPPSIRLLALSVRPEPIAREAAARYIAWFRDDYETELWRERALCDESPGVRARALSRLLPQKSKDPAIRRAALDALHFGTDDMAVETLWSMAMWEIHDERLWRAAAVRLPVAIQPTSAADLLMSIARESSPVRVDAMLLIAGAPALRDRVAQALSIMLDDVSPRHVSQMREVEAAWRAAGDAAAADLMSATIHAAETRQRETGVDGSGEVDAGE